MAAVHVNWYVEGWEIRLMLEEAGGVQGDWQACNAQSGIVAHTQTQQLPPLPPKAPIINARCQPVIQSVLCHKLVLL